MFDIFITEIPIKYVIDLSQKTAGKSMIFLSQKSPGKSVIDLSQKTT